MLNAGPDDQVRLQGVPSVFKYPGFCGNMTQIKTVIILGHTGNTRELDRKAAKKMFSYLLVTR